MADIAENRKLEQEILAAIRDIRFRNDVHIVIVVDNNGVSAKVRSVVYDDKE